MKLNLQLQDIETIYTREDILEKIDQITDSIEEFYKSIPPENFYLVPSDGGWSPEKNLRHLIKSTLPIYLGLLTPKFFYYAFGIRQNKSKSMSEIKNAYLAKLNTGSGAGVFTPVGNNTNVNPDGQMKLVMDFSNLFKKYKNQIFLWDDSDMDRLKMPHPILGFISVREMILFSIYHLFHHTKKIENRF